MNCLCLREGLGLIDHDFADVRAQMIADRADDDVAFLVDQERALALRRRLLDGAPKLQQVIEIPLQLLRVLAHPRGTHDQPHALRDFEAAHGLAQFGAVLPFDPPRYAAGARVVGHQHQVATGQREEGRQGRRPCCRAPPFSTWTTTSCPSLMSSSILRFPASKASLLKYDREISFIGRKPWRSAAIIDEGRLEAGLDAGDSSLVDIGFFHLPTGRFDIEIVTASGHRRWRRATLQAESR